MKRFYKNKRFLIAVASLMLCFTLNSKTMAMESDKTEQANITNLDEEPKDLIKQINDFADKTEQANTTAVNTENKTTASPNKIIDLYKNDNEKNNSTGLDFENNNEQYNTTTLNTENKTTNLPNQIINLYKNDNVVNKINNILDKTKKNNTNSLIGKKRNNNNINLEENDNEFADKTEQANTTTINTEKNKQNEATDLPNKIIDFYKSDNVVNKINSILDKTKKNNTNSLIGKKRNNNNNNINLDESYDEKNNKKSDLQIQEVNSNSKEQNKNEQNAETGLNDNKLVFENNDGLNFPAEKQNKIILFYFYKTPYSDLLYPTHKIIELNDEFKSKLKQIHKKVVDHEEFENDKCDDYNNFYNKCIEDLKKILGEDQQTSSAYFHIFLKPRCKFKEEKPKEELTEYEKIINDLITLNNMWNHVNQLPNPTNPNSYLKPPNLHISDSLENMYKNIPSISKQMLNSNSQTDLKNILKDAQSFHNTTFSNLISLYNKMLKNNNNKAFNTFTKVDDTNNLNNNSGKLSAFTKINNTNNLNNNSGKLSAFTKISSTNNLNVPTQNDNTIPLRYYYMDDKEGTVCRNTNFKIKICKEDLISLEKLKNAIIKLNTNDFFESNININYKNTVRECYKFLINIFKDYKYGNVSESDFQNYYLNILVSSCFKTYLKPLFNIRNQIEDKTMLQLNVKDKQQNSFKKISLYVDEDTLNGLDKLLVMAHNEKKFESFNDDGYKKIRKHYIEILLNILFGNNSSLSSFEDENNFATKYFDTHITPLLIENYDEQYKQEKNKKTNNLNSFFPDLIKNKKIKIIRSSKSNNSPFFEMLDVEVKNLKNFEKTFWYAIDSATHNKFYNDECSEYKNYRKEIVEMFKKFIDTSYSRIEFAFFDQYIRPFCQFEKNKPEPTDKDLGLPEVGTLILKNGNINITTKIQHLLRIIFKFIYELPEIPIDNIYYQQRKHFNNIISCLNSVFKEDSSNSEITREAIEEFYNEYVECLFDFTNDSLTKLPENIIEKMEKSLNLPVGKKIHLSKNTIKVSEEDLNNLKKIHEFVYKRTHSFSTYRIIDKRYTSNTNNRYIKLHKDCIEALKKIFSKFGSKSEELAYIYFDKKLKRMCLKPTDAELNLPKVDDKITLTITDEPEEITVVITKEILEKLKNDSDSAYNHTPFYSEDDPKYKTFRVNKIQKMKQYFDNDFQKAQAIYYKYIFPLIPFDIDLTPIC